MNFFAKWGALLMCGVLALTLGCKPGPNSSHKKDEYRANLVKAILVMRTTGNNARSICDRHSEAWKFAIRNEASITDAVQASLTDSKESIEAMNIGASEVQSVMAQLNPPPDAFTAVHMKVASTYGIFMDLVKAARSPSGSFNSYTANVDRLEGELTRALNELGVLIP